MKKCELCRAVLWPGEIDICDPCSIADLEYFDGKYYADDSDESDDYDKGLGVYDEH